MFKRDRIFIVAILVLAVGCHVMQSQVVSKPDPLSDAGSGMAGVVAHTESAERHVQQATPHADPEGKVLLKAASDEHKEVISDAAEVKTALTAAQGQVQTLQGQITGEQTRYSQLEGRWYVTWGRRIERALWLIGISWLLCGIASVALGMGNPLSWTWRIGKEITRLVPAMNIFSWIRDWLLARKQANDSYFAVKADQPRA